MPKLWREVWLGRWWLLSIPVACFATMIMVTSNADFSLTN